MWFGEFLSKIFFCFERSFLTVLNISISVILLILAVLLARYLLRKSAKWTRICLWALVALRLILPFSFPSPTSLIPSDEPVPVEVIQKEGIVVIDSGIPEVDQTVNPVLKKAEERPSKIVSTRIIGFFAAIVWCMGATTMLLYCLISFLKLRRRLRTATKLKDNIYQSEAVTSPFVFGLLRPKIYIPYHMAEEDMESVIAHERTHISRGDHMVKPFAFLLLSVYWFHPLVWLAYKLFCKDIELACDEKVIRRLNDAERKQYSEALFRVSVCPKMVRVCPLAFGEISVKERIRRVLDYKKPTLCLITVSVLILSAVGLCFATAPTQRPVDSLVNTVKKEEPLAQKHLKGVSREKIVKKWGAPTSVILNSHEEVYQAKYPKKEHSGYVPIDAHAILTYKNGKLKTFKNSPKPFLYEDDYSMVLAHDRTEFGGVEPTIVDATFEGDDLKVTVQWFNGSDKQITVGEYFDIDYHQGFTTWVNRSIHDNLCFTAIGYPIEPGKSYSHTYNFSLFNLMTVGTYRWKSDFITYGTGIKTDVWFEFKVINGYENHLPESEEDPSSDYDIYWLQSADAENDSDLPYIVPFVPYLQINDREKTFRFFYDPLSSYLHIGNYTVEDDILIATTSDGKYTYYFDFSETWRLRFLRERSSPLTWVDESKAIKPGKYPHFYLSGYPER